MKTLTEVVLFLLISGLTLIVTPSTASAVRLLNTRDIPIPFYRYTLWGDLDAETKAHATTLLYNEMTWNRRDFNRIEASSLSNIEIENSGQFDAILAIGFDEEVWDCYVNHYGDYLWAELEEEGVQQYYEALGWSEGTWEELNFSPTTSELLWSELSNAERAAAEEICYTLELWNEVSLDLWSILPEAPTDSPIEATTSPIEPTGSPIETTTSPIEPTGSPTLMPTLSLPPSSTVLQTAAPVTSAPITQEPSDMPTIPLSSSSRLPTDMPTFPRTSAPTTSSLSPTMPLSSSPQIKACSLVFVLVASTFAALAIW
jgi:hypothetical protein